MRVFDTHAHYDSGAFNADRLELLASMPQQDVCYTLKIFTMCCRFSKPAGGCS